MKFKSISELYSSSLNSLKRFPLVVLCGLLSSLTAILLHEYKADKETADILSELLVNFMLGLPLFCSLRSYF